jgi:hypothetical protein
LIKQNQVSRVSPISSDGKSWTKAGDLAELFEPPKSGDAVGNSGGPIGQSWYYSSGGAKSGPHDVTEIANLLKIGSLTGSDLAWRQGMSQWQQINAISELANLIPAPVSSNDFPIGGSGDPFAANADPFSNSGQTLPNPYWTNPEQQPRRMTKHRPGTRVGRTELEPNPDDGGTILILGIIGIFFFPCAFVAWAMGASYVSRCKEMEYLPGSGGKTGYVLGMVFSIIYLLSVAGFCCLYGGFFALMVGAAGAGGI